MTNTRVHEVLSRSPAAAFPGVFDALSARIAEQVGFPMAFISGYSVAATDLGVPDFGLLTQTEMIDRARRVCQSVSIPILVDADTGYGNPLNVRRTVLELMAIGAAGCFLEDQQWPKRCGHLQGKQIIPRDEYLAKIAAAVDARAEGDFFLVARTDALAVAGMDEAVARVEAARDLGADASFIEAPASRDALAEIGRRAPAPNVANMIEGGKTPVLPLAELEQLGFQFVLYPLCGLFAATQAIQSVYETLLQKATTTGGATPQATFDQFNRLIGLQQHLDLARKYGADR